MNEFPMDDSVELQLVRQQCADVVWGLMRSAQHLHATATTPEEEAYARGYQDAIDHAYDILSLSSLIRKDKTR